MAIILKQSMKILNLRINYFKVMLIKTKTYPKYKIKPNQTKNWKKKSINMKIYQIKYQMILKIQLK
jgi:hypothetical protein